MKKLLFILTVLFTFCSCAKNYPKLVKDKAEQYKKEGKIILNQSNDSTGKEHYIVYADVQNQVIGIDTLGDSVRVMHLGKKKYFEPDLKVEKGEEMKINFYRVDPTTTAIVAPTFSITKDGKLLWDGEEYKISAVYKDKYLVCKGSWDLILFLNKDEVFYGIRWDKYRDKINTDGSINYEVTRDIYDLIDEEENYAWPDYDGYEYYIDKDHMSVGVKVKIFPNGEIIPLENYADWCGVRVPLKDFATWDMLAPYVLEVVAKQEQENRAYWKCENCGLTVISAYMPENNSRCNGSYKGTHQWAFSDLVSK